MAGYGLSKSRITAWRQCPKRLWLQTNRRDLLVDSDQAEQAFQIGNEIGEIARQLCPNGLLIKDDDNLSAAIASTRAAISNYPARPIFEATFQHDGLLVRTDVLLPTRKGYRMAEVKSSTSVKPYHIEDCAVQAWVLKQNNVKLAAIELVHVDTSFVYQGGGDYYGILKSVRLDGEVATLLDSVPVWVSGARRTLSGDEPVIEPGAQCNDPFECPFKEHCTKNMIQPEELQYPLDIFNGMRQQKKEELRNKGYVDAREVPEEYLSEKHRWVQSVSKKGKAELLDGAAKQLAAFPYPRYYLDFETIALAVPRWAQTRPYASMVPFQWSCHIELAPGKLHHEMFLDVSGNDPRRSFAETMIKALGSKGPVMVYNQSFEKSRIRELADLFPDLSRKLLAINERVVDLLPIAQQHYYHPDMKGSWSIKSVLPTIAKDLQYSDLAVGDGEDAQSAYREIVHPHTHEARKQALTEALRAYCTMDTLAMVRLAWFFQGNAKPTRKVP